MSPPGVDLPHPPLRVGLAVAPGPQPWWVVELLRELALEGSIEVLFCLEVPAALNEPPAPSWLVRAHGWLDQWVYGDDFDVQQRVPMDDLLTGVPRASLDAASGSQRVADLVREARLDVILDLGVRALPLDVGDAVRFGAWSHSHLGEVGAPAGLWESLHGESVSGVRLVSTLAGSRHLIGTAWSATDFLSPIRNQRALCRHAMALLPRAVHLVRTRGTSGFDSLMREGEVAGIASSHREWPTGVQMARLLLRRAVRSVASRIRNLARTERWEIGIWRHDTSAGDVQAPDHALERAALVPCPSDRYWADPFCVRHGDGWVLFAEELPYATQRGRIVAAEVGADGTVGSMRVVLEMPYHLSYPFVFRAQGHWYMMPETYDAFRVELFRAVEFPWRWERHATLLDNIALVDGTLHEHEGRWWLFGGLGTHRGSPSEQLHLFSAPALAGPWAPHPENPVCTDVRHSRPAGRLFSRGGRLYRPAQDCAQSYGQAVVITEVTCLSPTHFSEVVSERRDPSWRADLAGMHTVNADGGLTVIDVRRRIPRWRA